MSKKMLNFDQFLAEKNKDYIEVTVYGKVYKVKREVPAIVPIMIGRAGEDADEKLLGEAMMRAGDIMFGKDVIDELCDKGISATELGHLIRQVFTMVSGQDVDGDEDSATYDDSSRYKKKDTPRK